MLVRVCMCTQMCACVRACVAATVQLKLTPTRLISCALSGTIVSGALYTYAGDNVVQGFAACFWASVAFVILSGVCVTDNKGWPEPCVCICMYIYAVYDSKFGDFQANNMNAVYMYIYRHGAGHPYFSSSFATCPVSGLYERHSPRSMC